LIAYYIPSSAAPQNSAQLREVLRRKLPDFMIPSQFVELPAFPRTPNGKLDRKALPPPSMEAIAPCHEAIAPRTPAEEMVMRAFRGVLKRADFGVFENFFDLGGHSLMAARLMSGLRTASGLDIPLRQLFAHPTAAGLAEAINALQWLQGANAPANDNSLREEIVL
jgi:phosphopantetheine binding protein